MKKNIMIDMPYFSSLPIKINLLTILLDYDLEIKSDIKLFLVSTSKKMQ